MRQRTLEIRFLGGCGEVGRAAIAVKSRKAQILLDYGVIFDHEPGFPMHMPPREVDAIILTHAHLDHSGAIPIFHIQNSKPVFGTAPTFDLTHLLIRDFLKISGYYLPFEYIDLRSMIKSSISLDYKEETELEDFKFKLLDSGHIPGSCQVLLEADGKRLLYTGDYNTIKTRLLKSADTNYGEVDAVIMESTYANEDHAPREALEKEFVSKVKEIIENGGTVLVPAFSVARAQEIACILTAYNFKHTMYMDGMALKVNRIFMNHSSFLRSPMLLREALHRVRWVKGGKDRRAALKSSCVIISPAGMLKGGPAAFYIQTIAKKKNNAIFLVGYQVEGTPGRELYEHHKCVIDGRVRKVKAVVDRFDFSSHCGATELRRTVEKLKGNPKIYVIHGEKANCKLLAKWIKKEVGFEAVAPKTGDTFTL